MRIRNIGVISALLMASVSFVVPTQASQQLEAAKTSAATPMPPQDLSGTWLLTTKGRIRSLSKQAPPMTLLGQEKFNANKPGFGPRAVPGGNDPIGHCDPPGLPRTLMSERPIQFAQLPGRMVQFLESYRTWRDMWTDGRELPKDPDPRWYGYSIGKWQGDTFVVDSAGFDERSWADSLGYPHSDAMHLQERYRRVGHDTLELTITLDDPTIYTKPWVSDRQTLKLQPRQELEEDFCVGSEEESFNQRLRLPAAGK
jgi:hypothetical protein